jgi:hypothetical protein
MGWGRLLQFVLLAGLGLVTACAGQMPVKDTVSAEAAATQSPEEALRAQATKFWEARIKGDMVTQYDLLEPKAKEGVTLTGFALARAGVRFLSYTINEVEAVDDQGRVAAEATFKLNHPKTARFGPWTQAVVTRWVREGGVWYLKRDQDEAGKPPEAAKRQP